MNKLYRDFLNWFFECAIVITGLSYAGSVLDNKFHTGANCMSLGLLLGFGMQAYSFYKLYKRSLNNKE